MRWMAWGMMVLWSMACLAGPATRPAAVRIGVMPFTAIGPARGYEWMGKAIQRSLIADLSKMDGVQALEMKSPKSTDDVDWVVEGEFQILEPNLRITGQVIDVHGGEVIGGIKSSGGVRDLFALEDAAGMQIKRMLLKPAADEATPESAPTRQQIKTPTDVRLGQYSVRPYAGSALQRAVNGDGVVDQYRREQTYYNRYMTGWPAFGYGYYNAPYGPYGYGVPVYGWGCGACRIYRH